jgi:hypothetical protein
MNQVKIYKPNKSVLGSAIMLKAILEEIRLLRNEIMFLFPQENLEEYAHPVRIKRSYQKAIKQHPPVSLAWK